MLRELSALLSTLGKPDTSLAFLFADFRHELMFGVALERPVGCWGLDAVTICVASTSTQSALMRNVFAFAAVGSTVPIFVGVLFVVLAPRSLPLHAMVKFIALKL